MSPATDGRRARARTARRSGRSVVVTGGAGFVGTNVVDRFASRGDRVTVLDDLSRSGVERNLRWLQATHGDRVGVRVASVVDADAVHAAVAGADVVFHLAAQVAVTTSVRHPVHDFGVNAQGTLNVLEAVRAQRRPPAVLFTSTNKVYGALDDIGLAEAETRWQPEDPAWRAGVAESRPLDFRSPYGCSKGAADQYVLDYARIYGLRTVVLRMSCIYGPHQHGNEDQGWVAHFLLRLLRGRSITIYGDGKQVRDVLYVQDLVDAFERAVEGIDDLAGQAFNVGGGAERSTSLLELVARMQDLEAGPLEVELGPWRPGDQRWYVSDTARFRERTGWEPEVGVEEGIERLHRWLADNGAQGAAGLATATATAAAG